ncbi:unnamed protein product, partial [Closterium sp. NIES-53]
ATATAPATATVATAAIAPDCCIAMASLPVLAFDPEGRPVQFDTCLDDLQLYLLSDIKDGVSLFDHVSGATTAPPTTADGATRSLWLSHDAAARLAICNHLALAECAHFGQHRTAQALYDAVVTHYSSPAIAALGRLLLPYLFPELSAFATVEDMVSHLCASDARYHTAVPAEFLDKNPPPMFITLYFIVTRLPDSLLSVKDHFLSLDPTSLTIDLLEQHLLADVSVAENVGAASASAKRRSGKGKGGKGGGGGSGGGGGGIGSSGGGSSGGGGGSGTGGGSGSSGGGSGGSGGSGGGGGSGTGGGGTGAQRVGSGGGQRQQQQRRSETQSPQIAIFDLDFYAILSAMYALSVSAEGDCYRCVPPHPGIAASALGASESRTLPGTAPAQALHTFTLDSGASACFIRDSTTLTPLSTPVPVRLADPSGGPVVACFSTVLSCPAVPSGSLSGLHLPLFSANLVSTAALQDAMVTTTTPGGVCVGSGSRLLLESPPVAPDSSVAPPPGSPLPAMPSWHALSSSCLWSSQVPASPADLACPALPSLHRGAAARRSSFLLVSSENCSSADAPHGRVVDVLIPWIRTVRLQLREHFGHDLPNLRLHSDRGGDFSSSLLRDICRGEGILLPLCPSPAPIALPCSQSPSGRPPPASGSCSLRCVSGRPTPVEIAVGSGAAQGAASGGAASGGAELEGAGSEGAGFGGAESGGAEPGGEERGGAEPVGVEPEGAEPGGAESEGAESGGAGPRGAASSGGPAGASPQLSSQQLREWFVRRARPRSGVTGVGDAEAGGAGVTTGAGGPRGTAATGPGGARTRGTGAAGAGGVEGAGAGVTTVLGAPGAGGTGVGGAGASGVGAVDPGVGGAGDIVQPRLYFVPVLQQVLGVSSSTGLTPPLLCPPPDQSQLPLQPASSLPAPCPYTEQSGGLTERREPASRPVSPFCTARRVPHSRPPPVPSTHTMALRPSSVPLRIPLPPPPESSLPEVPDPESDRTRAASPTIARLLATANTDPSFESAAASAVVAELLDFAAACRLDYATALVAESASASPPSVGGECALGTDVLEDKQEDFECLAAAVPRFASMLLAPEGDPDAPDILTWAEHSRWHVDFQGFSQRQGVDYFQTFCPTPKMTTLRVLLHVVAQRDYELHSLDFSTAFLQGSLHEEIWLRRPPGFTELFLTGTQWSLRRPVYGLRQAPREWHDTLRTTLAALGFTPATADPWLFLRTDTSLPPFYVLVYVDDLVFVTPDTEALTLVKSELQKRHTCTDLESSGPYPELVGCLMYLMTCTRPDLAYPLSLLASYVAPGRHRKVHWDAAKRVLRYLCSTSGTGLVHGGRGPVVLTGHADASWVDDSATQRSSQGYTFSLGSGSISWRSTRSSSVLSSSCEAEIYAGTMAA